MWCNHLKVANGDVFKTILRDMSILWRQPNLSSFFPFSYQVVQYMLFNKK